MPNEAEELRETIELTNFLTTKQVEDILNIAIKRAPTGNYEAKLEIKSLIDELSRRGLSLDSKFEVEGTSWKCPKCERMLTGVAKCPCGHVNETIIPKGTYEFLFEQDLGRVSSYCQNYACGHPIRFEEHILHVETGKRFIVGNVCVQHILGEHDLVKIAISLLAKCSRKVEKLNKAKKCDDICGDILRKVVETDPKHRFTKPEFLFLDAIENAQTKVTIKKAKEFAEKWTDNDIDELKKKVIEEAEHEKKSQYKRNEETEDWIRFLRYKKDRHKDRDSDFWENCLEVTEREGRPTAGQRNAIQGEFERYKKIIIGDASVLGDLPSTVKYMAEKMLSHASQCQSYFHIGLLEQLLTRGDLSEKQISTLKSGCRKCNWRLD